VVIVMSLIQVGYCIALYIKMSAEPKAVTSDT
jgi:hypothetical protein